MKIPFVFQPHETLAEKEECLAHEEMEEEEGDEMEIEEEEGETSLESIDYPPNPSTKTLLKNQKTIVENQQILKRSVVRI